MSAPARARSDGLTLWEPARCAAVDRYTIDELGIPSAVLIERAALAVAAVCEQVAVARWGAPGTALEVLCGPGNNGADGYALARIWAGRGRRARVWPVAPPASADCRQQAQWAVRLGVDVGVGPVELEPGPASRLLVDAIFGTSARPGLPAGIGELFDRLAAWRAGADAAVVAVDLPTGVCAATGRVERVLGADHTVTFQRSKPGLHTGPGARAAGRVHVAAIGLVDLPLDRLVSAPPEPALMTGAAARALVAARTIPEHKHAAGAVLVLGGDPGTRGAVVLAALGARAAGAGLVSVSAPDDPGSFADAVVARHPTLMTRPWPEAAAALAARSVLCVGPGLTRPASIALVRGWWDTHPAAAVFDAGIVASLTAPPGPGAGPRICTPHPGEAARWLTAATGAAETAADVEGDRLAAARRLAALSGALVVLKGRGTVVAAPDGQVAVASAGDENLATAGSGDVLAGAIAGLCACGLSPWAAANVAVHAHGQAGTRGRARLGRTPTAAELADGLGCALTALEPGVREPAVLEA